MKPKVSVLIPHYNHGDEIGSCLESIINQNFVDYEIIIVDDCSDDGSFKILENWKNKCPKIKLFRNEKNQGPCNSVNSHLNKIEGEYVIFRAADDLTTPKFFKNASSLLDQHPKAGMCTGNIAFFSKDPNSYSVESLGLSDSSKYFAPDDLIENWRTDFNIPGSASMYRYTHLADTGFYLPDLKWYSDWMLTMVIAFRHGLVYCPEIFTKFKLDSESYSTSNLNNKISQFIVYKNILLEIRNRYPEIMPAMMKTGALDLFSPWIVDAYYSYPELWHIEILNMLQKPIYNLNRRKSISSNSYGISKNIVSRVEEKKNKICNALISNKFQEVIVYGAGLHTEKLLSIWESLQMHPISTIITSDCEVPYLLDNIPVKNLQSMNPNGSYLILISSKSFENIMLEKCKLYFKDSCYLTFWSNEESTI